MLIDQVLRIAIIAGLSWLASAFPARALPVVQTVFYDMPAEMIAGPMPEPTAQLLAVPDYPDDPERMTLVARLYWPDAACSPNYERPKDIVEDPVKRPVPSPVRIPDHLPIPRFCGTPNQKARRRARDEVLRWLDYKLGPEPVLEIQKSPDPPHDLTLSWETRPRLAYSLEFGPSPAAWEGSTPWANGTGNPAIHPAPAAERMFFRLQYRTADAPVNEPENAGFFLSYEDFDL